MNCAKQHTLNTKELFAFDTILNIMSKNTYLTHSLNVAQLMLNMYRIIKKSNSVFLPENENTFFLAGIAHDIGKKMIPLSILDKTTALDLKEKEIMQLHPKIGKTVMETQKIDQNIKNEILPSILYHHERWDGNGYPYNLKGLDIPIIARLCSIADAYDAIISNRPYKAGSSHDTALFVLVSCAGTQFDPQLVQILTNDMSWVPKNEPQKLEKQL